MDLFGADPLVAAMQASARRNSAAWKPSRPLHANLSRVLGVGLARRPADASGDGDDEGGMECGICFCQRRGEGDDALPDKACSSATCGRLFHVACLSEWLHSLPDARSAFGTVFGACPFCSEPISAKVQGDDHARA